MMPDQTSKRVVTKFPLRLTLSVRKGAELFSAQEGVSLNQFIKIAVAEKLVLIEHDARVRNRKQPSPQLITMALSLLGKAGSLPEGPGDELPPSIQTGRVRRNSNPRKEAK